MSSPYTGVHQFLATSKRIIEFCEGHSPEPKVFITLGDTLVVVPIIDSIV